LVLLILFKAFADALQGKLFSPQDKARETTTLIQHNGVMRELVKENDKPGKPSQAPAYALVADPITGKLEHIYLDELLNQLHSEGDGVVVLLVLLALMFPVKEIPWLAHGSTDTTCMTFASIAAERGPELMNLAVALGKRVALLIVDPVPAVQPPDYLEKWTNVMQNKTWHSCMTETLNTMEALESGGASIVICSAYFSSFMELSKHPLYLTDGWARLDHEDLLGLDLVDDSLSEPASTLVWVKPVDALQRYLLACPHPSYLSAAAARIRNLLLVRCVVLQVGKEYPQLVNQYPGLGHVLDLEGWTKMARTVKTIMDDADKRQSFEDLLLARGQG